MGGKAILFDLDDTLYEYEPNHTKALKEVYNILKDIIKIDFNKFNYLYKGSKTEVKRELAGTASCHNRVLYFQRLIEKTHNTIESEVVLTLYETYRGTFLDSMKLREGAMEVLTYLKDKGIKTAIVSDLTTHIQLRKMRKLGITPYIDHLITSEEAGIEKPHPIMFLLALNKLNILPKNALMVGDNPVNDIEGANALGIDTILISSENNLKSIGKENYKKPNHIIKSLKEIIKIIEK